MQVFVKYFLSIFFILITTSVLSQESLVQEVDTIYLRKLIDTAKVYYPKMQTFDHRINIAAEDIKKAKLSWYDVLTFSLSYSPTNSTNIAQPTLSGYQVGMFLNLGSLLIKAPNIRQSREEFAIAKLNKSEYNLNIEAQVKSLYYRYIQEKIILRLQKQTELDVGGLLNQIKYKFEKGEESFENYSKALISSSGAKQNVIASEGLVLIAKSSLEEIVGKKLEDIH